MEAKYIYLLLVPLFVVLGLQNIYMFPYYWLGVEKFFHIKVTKIVANPVARILVSFTVFLLLFYLFIIFFYNYFIKRPPNRKFLLFLSYTFFFLEIVVPMFFIIGKRVHSTDKVYLTHDGGVVQTEIAMQLLLKQTNPYGYNYMKTNMAQSFHLEGLRRRGKRLDPDYTALYHYPYFPGSFLLSLPFYVVWRWIFSFYDQRIFYFIVFLIMLYVVSYLVREEAKPAVPVLLGIFPWYSYFFITGRNEALYIPLIIVSLVFLKAHKIKMSFFTLALAGSVKQFALLLLPFYLLYVIKNKIPFLGGLVIYFITLSVIILPFFFWNQQAFLDDTLYHNVGLSKTPYPLGGTPGYGFSNFILVLGNLKSRYVYFPFSYFSVFALGLIFFFTFFIKPYGIEDMLFSFGIAFLFFAYFGRMFHDNYLVAGLYLMTVSIFIEESVHE